MQNFLIFIAFSVLLKNVLMGGDYSPYLHIQFGREYWEWYSDRPSFIDYLKSK